MDHLVRDVNVHYEDAGSGRPILILHGWPGDGLTTMPEFEPFFASRPGWRRIYADVMGLPKAPVPDWLQGPDDVLDVLIEFMDLVAPGDRVHRGWRLERRLFRPGDRPPSAGSG